MKGYFARTIIVCGALFGSVLAQTENHSFSAAVLNAKTIAVINDTKDSGLTKGADTALRSWGQFKLVDDPTSADITLHFEKVRERAGASTQKTDDNGKPTDYGYSMSFSSSTHMKAYAKDGDTPFFSTKTDDSKTKGGMQCVDNFHTAYRAARQQSKP